MPLCLSLLLFFFSFFFSRLNEPSSFNLSLPVLLPKAVTVLFLLLRTAFCFFFSFCICSEMTLWMLQKGKLLAAAFRQTAELIAMGYCGC